MVFSYYLYKYPYKLIWRLLRLLNQTDDIVTYLADPLDYIALKPILNHLPPVSFVCKNKKTLRYLELQGINGKCLPAFPRVVLMSRHAAHKFPEQQIIKIGCRHGAYHFKAFTKTANYNAFDIYFVTSRREVEIAETQGITTSRAVGFPKLDPVFDGSLNEEILDIYRTKAEIAANRKTVIFTATWDKSGMSAIDQWIDKLQYFTKKYNVLVTVHPWTSQCYITKLKKTSGVYFIDAPDVLPYLMLADVMVADNSSIIAEFCALDKPIITLETKQTRRSVDEIDLLLKDISIRVQNFAELYPAIEQSIINPKAQSSQRQNANNLMFNDYLDGKSGERVAKIIKELLESNTNRERHSGPKRGSTNFDQSI